MLMSRLKTRHEKALHLPTRYDGALLQLGMQGDPWRVGLASLLLQRTTRRQAVLGLQALLSNWPQPCLLAAAPFCRVAECLRPCGLQHRRAIVVIDFSKRLAAGYGRIQDIRGLDAYVRDTIRMFCFDTYNIPSGDRSLKAYCEVFA